MDRYRLAVVVEDHDLQKPPGAVGTDVEVAVALVECLLEQALLSDPAMDRIRPSDDRCRRSAVTREPVSGR